MSQVIRFDHGHKAVVWLSLRLRGKHRKALRGKQLLQPVRQFRVVDCSLRHLGS
jgi:hypothetical protein